MARIESLNLLNSQDGKAFLAEQYKTMLDEISKETLSFKLKNKDISGIPVKGGTVVARRFVNAEIEDYGTARKAGKGKAARFDEIDVKIDTNRELIEEVEAKDIGLSGVDGLVKNRIAKQKLALKSELEDRFFAEAKKGAGKNKVSYKDTDKIEDILEDFIQALEITKNDFVRGVERNEIVLVLSPKLYGKARIYIDKIKGVDKEEITLFHGVEVYSSIYLPDKTDAIAMVKEQIAQPVKINVMNPSPIDLSDAFGFGTFAYYGTKTLAPDLIYVLEKSAGAAA